MKEKTVKDFVKAVKKSTKQTSAYDTTAKVMRVEGDTAWVHIAGGVDETPVKMTVKAKQGDNVQVRVSGGRAFIVGNATAPPTDDATAIIARTTAQTAQTTAMNADQTATAAQVEAVRAKQAADEAEAVAQEVNGIAVQARTDAQTAKENAQTAVTNAGIAQTAATQAQRGLAQVESVVDTLNWLTEHSKVTTDQTPVADKIYYIKNQDNTFSLVTDTTGKNPATEGWYEMDEAIANYVASHLYLDNDGLHVIADGSDWSVLVKNDGVYILDPQGIEAAQFKSYARLGKSGETHAEIDYHSMQLVDKEGTTYFYISDLRGTDGTAEITDFFYGDASTTVFDLSLRATTNTYSVKVNDVEISTDITKFTSYIKFTTAPSLGAVIEVTYNTVSASAKAYSLGKRVANSNIGVFSFIEGFSTEAVGSFSHAEGNNTRAAGTCSHAEGFSTEAGGIYSHAEGFSTEAGGKYSHAEGNGTYAGGNFSHAEGKSTEAVGSFSHAEGNGTYAEGKNSHTGGLNTIARYDEQTIIGKYNSNQSNTAFEIGNGANLERSNAFTVDWSGNVKAYGEIEDGNGNTLFSGNYNDLTNKPTIPTKTSQLTNDSRFLSSDASGNVHINGTITVEDHANEIGRNGSYSGSKPINSSTSSSALSGTYSLSKGVWILVGHAEFPVGTGSGVRSLRWYDTKGGTDGNGGVIAESPVTSYATSGFIGRLQSVCIFSHNDTFSHPVRLDCFHSTGGQITVSYRARYVRIA